MILIKSESMLFNRLSCVAERAGNEIAPPSAARLRWAVPVIPGPAGFRKRHHICKTLPFGQPSRV